MAACKDNIDKNRLHSDRNVLELVAAHYGKDAKVSKEDHDNIEEPYLKNHELHLLDPCEIEKKITELDDKIDEFLKEVDICLTESNSRTEIEVPE